MCYPQLYRLPDKGSFVLSKCVVVSPSGLSFSVDTYEHMNIFMITATSGVSFNVESRFENQLLRTAGLKGPRPYCSSRSEPRGQETPPGITAFRARCQL